MQQFQRKLREAISRFLETSQESDLVEFLENNLDCFADLTGEYPDLHRVMDLHIRDSCYRLIRLASKNERLAFVPINPSIYCDEIGTPLWLEGEQLRRWVEDETNEPKKDPVDWNEYKNEW